MEFHSLFPEWSIFNMNDLDNVFSFFSTNFPLKLALVLVSRDGVPNACLSNIINIFFHCIAAHEVYYLLNSWKWDKVPECPGILAEVLHMVFLVWFKTVIAIEHGPSKSLPSSINNYTTWSTDILRGLLPNHQICVLIISYLDRFHSSSILNQIIRIKIRTLILHLHLNLHWSKLAIMYSVSQYHEKFPFSLSPKKSREWKSYRISWLPIWEEDGFVPKKSWNFFLYDNLCPYPTNSLHHNGKHHHRSNGSD